MDLRVYIDGKLVPREKAVVSVFDHGLLYGDGVFEGIRAYGGRIFRLGEHVRRLYDSARCILLKIPLAPAAMEKAIRDTLVANRLKDGYIRVVVTRGVGTLGLDPDRCPRPSVIIIVGHIAIYPAEVYEKGLDIVTVPTLRNHAAALSPRVKSLNYLNNIMAKIEGKNAGTVEALMLNPSGFVGECTGDNIFIAKDGVVRTPPPWEGILKGITRGAVMELVRKRRIPLVEEPLTRYDLFVADECFLTGTAAEVVPVVRIDGRVIGEGRPGPVTKRLLADFRRLVRGPAAGGKPLR
ncbi:MAG: branched-chain-amino-acid transaminase [Planctomycetota bacterium]